MLGFFTYSGLYTGSAFADFLLNQLGSKGRGSLAGRWGHRQWRNSLFFQDEDAGIGTHRMPYSRDVDGVVGLNYRVQPLPLGRRTNADTDRAFRSAARARPSTPVLHAYTGDAVRIHVLAPWSEQEQVFSLEGHAWPREPGRPGTDLVSSVAFGGLDALTLDVVGGAGGVARLPGDYLYGRSSARAALPAENVWAPQGDKRSITHPPLAARQ